MRKSFHQTLTILAICLLILQTVFGSLPAVATSELSSLQVTMTTNGQPYEEGENATSAVAIQVTTTTTDSAHVEISINEGRSWQPFNVAEPLIIEEVGEHSLWFRLGGEVASLQKYTIRIVPPLALTSTTTADSAVIYVNQEANGNGTSWTDAYQDLQPALDAAQIKLDAGVRDVEIWIAKGVYKPTKESDRSDHRTAFFQMKNGVEIYGGFEGTENARAKRNFKTNETILSGDIGIVGDESDNAYHVFFHDTGLNLDTTAILDGVTITKGNANASKMPHDSGGGMFNENSSPMVTNVEFIGNEAKNGGGMHNENSSPTVTNVKFSKNTVTTFGGGMYNYGSSDSLMVTNVEFIENEAKNGGGMYNDSSDPKVTNVKFSKNIAKINGGGMYNSKSSSLKVRDVEFIGNKAGTGGGMFNSKSILTVTNVEFIGNEARNDGGGMYNGSSSPTVTNVRFIENEASDGGGMHNISSSPAVTNVEFIGNGASDGGGMSNWNWSDPTLTNVTMSGNTTNGNKEAAIYNHSTSKPKIHNSIIIGNDGPAYNGKPTINNSLIGDEQGGQLYDNAGKLDGQKYLIEDIFIDPGNENYRLKVGSPAIDKGNSLYPELTDIKEDLDGNPRIYGAGIDFGAYESQVTSYKVAYDKNGATTGDVPSNMFYEKGDTVTIQGNSGKLMRKGYTFTGWDTQSDGQGTTYKADETFLIGAANVTLYAKWTKNPTYTVTYDGNGATSGQVPTSASYEETATVIVEGNSGSLEKPNHTFTGWNTQADGKGTAYVVGDKFRMGTANITLYAEWKANPPTIGGDPTPPPTSLNNDDDDNDYSSPTTVKITLYSNDGTILESINITYNTKVSDLPVPTRAGFHFDGWYEDEALTKRWVEETLVRENISLYAKWTAVKSKPETPQEPQFPTPKPTVTFDDINQHWAQEMIEELATLGIIQGYEDGTFRPNAPISRMHVAALLTRAFPFENMRAVKEFSDISPDHPYYEAILTLQQAGIIDGTNGAFLPKENMTRAELAKVLVGVLGFTPQGTASFSDVTKTHWSSGYIAVLEREGIALGDNGKYNPNDPVTRAQFATFLHRVLNL